MALSLAGANVQLRWDDPAAVVWPVGLVLSATMAGVVMVTGWLGGTLTFKHGIGTYGENRPADNYRLYPRFARTADEPADPRKFVSPAWSFRADRAATPAVFAWGPAAGLALAVDEHSPLGLTGDAFMRKLIASGFLGPLRDVLVAARPQLRRVWEEFGDTVNLVP
jgi:hypothetical protein